MIKNIYNNIVINNNQITIPYYIDTNILPNNPAIKAVYRKYNDSDLTINELYFLSQQNCFYCNSKPSNKISVGRSKSNRIKNEFIYNGLDRIDNTINHSKSNVVPCCRQCNYAKSDSTYNDFIDLIKRIDLNLNLS